MRIWAIFIILMSMTSLAWASSYQVVAVERADLLELSIGQKVQLIGVQEWGEEYSAWQEQARIFVSAITADQPIYLEYDLSRRDPWGHLWAYVWIPTNTQSKLDLLANPQLFELTFQTEEGEVQGAFLLLNAALLQAGLVKPVRSMPNVKYQYLLHRLAREAKDFQKGVWATP